MDILWLRQHFAWMGSQSGYDQLCRHIENIESRTASVWRYQQPRRGRAGPLLARLTGAPATALYDSSSAAAELRAIWSSLISSPRLIHVLYVEENYGLLAKWKRLKNFCLVGTAHQPETWWKSQQAMQGLGAFDALIAVSTRQADFLEPCARGRVHFIPHGIDVDFFRPADEQRSPSSQPPAFVFCGSWLRDFDTLEKIVHHFEKRGAPATFDLVIPPHARKNPVLARLAAKRLVTLHHGITDEQLRSLYQRAVSLILPIHDCTANNAVLEAMACGLPVIASDVGGLRDYTAGSFAALVRPGDSQSFVECMLLLVEDPEERKKRGIAARQHAVENFSWDKIARKTAEVYQTAMSQAASS